MYEMQTTAGMTDEEKVEYIRKNYGNEAAEAFKRNGVLTINEAVRYRNKITKEHYGFTTHEYGEGGNMSGWRL